MKGTIRNEVHTDLSKLEFDITRLQQMEPIHIEDTAKYQQEISSLQSQSTQLRSNNTRLMNEISILTDQVVNLQSTAQQEQHHLRAVIARLEHELSTHQIVTNKDNDTCVDNHLAEISRLTCDLTEFQRKTKEDTERLESTYRLEIAALQQEIFTLQSQSNSRLDELLTVISRLETEKAAAQSQATMEKHRLEGFYRTEVTRLEGELTQKFQGDIQQKETEIVRLRSEFSSSMLICQAQIDSLQFDLTTMQARIGMGINMV